MLYDHLQAPGTLPQILLGIIHGDIKPANVLVDEDVEGGHVARLIDFGYSTFFADSDYVRMPRSVPWAAPEWPENEITTPAAAKRMDVYSLGVLCLWLLFNSEKLVSENIVPGQNTHVSMLDLALRLVSCSSILSLSLKENLSLFFERTLAPIADDRSIDCSYLLGLLGVPEKLPNKLKLAVRTANRTERTSLADMISASQFSVSVLLIIVVILFLITSCKCSDCPISTSAFLIKSTSQVQHFENTRTHWERGRQTKITESGF